MSTSSSALFISWIEHHGRSADLARCLGIEAVFVPGGSGSVVRRYARQTQETRRLLKDLSPTSIIVMQPPLPALLAVLSTRAGRRAQLIGDLHTGTFENPAWRWALPTVLRLLRRRGFAVVTNEPLAVRARARGVTAVVVDDPLSDDELSASADFDDSRLADVASRPFMLVPFAYANDEPVSELLEAARALPDVTFVLTGKAPDAVRSAAPPNVVLTGFVSHDDFQRLLIRASAVAALTDREFTMQRAGYEALMGRKPLLTAETATLRAYFGEAAVYAAPSTAAIASGVETVFARLDVYREQMSELRLTKIDEQRSRLEQLTAALTGDTNAS